MQVFFGRDIYPEVYIAPRGLITVLLFFAIPKELQVADFQNGILLFVIIATSFVMTWALIRSNQKDLGDEVLEMLGKDSERSEIEQNGTSDSVNTANNGDTPKQTNH